MISDLHPLLVPGRLWAGNHAFWVSVVSSTALFVIILWISSCKRFSSALECLRGFGGCILLEGLLGERHPEALYSL